MHLPAPVIAPYGTWPSPISAADLAVAGARIDGARFVADEVWWSESVPAERGRVSVRRTRNSGSSIEVLPAPWSARSRAHEYGGGAWTADASGTLFFVEASDQRVYRLDSAGADPVPLTPAGPRHGGLRVQYGRLLAVREDSETHLRAIVEIPTDGSAADDVSHVRVFVQGTAFWAHPALSPDGTRVAFVEWSGLQMPWDSARLCVIEVGGDVFAEVPARAALQPEWVSDNELLYSDDPSGRWNIHRVSLDGLAVTATPQAVAPADADTGGGLWVLGQRWFRPLENRQIAALRTNGTDELVVIEADGTTVRVLDVPMNAGLSIEDAAGTRVLVTGSGPAVKAGLWCVDTATGTVSAIRGGEAVDADWMPRAQPITFDGPHGPVHAFDYPPTHPDTKAPSGEQAPYVVYVHSGPTAHVSGAASPAIAFLTSRGIGVLDVNYGGSTGYGRAYRERLNGQWGVVDVDDVLVAAAGLANAGVADSARLAIRGGSAGGWTVLSALARGGVFTAGISRYGVSDLRSLVADSPDFEKHYIDTLVGPLPEAEALYIERSPLTNAAHINVPVLLLQGADDQVVPPSQSEVIRDALASQGVPHEYRLFEGEGHSFRQATTLIAAAEAELRFLGRCFGFEPKL